MQEKVVLDKKKIISKMDQVVQKNLKLNEMKKTVSGFSNMKTTSMMIPLKTIDFSVNLNGGSIPAPPAMNNTANRKLK